MGYKTEFNWVLKLKKEQGFPENLKKGATCQFQKRETRIYPIQIPLFLADSSWNVCASVIIKEFTVKDDTTSGIFDCINNISQSKSLKMPQSNANFHEF